MGRLNTALNSPFLINELLELTALEVERRLRLERPETQNQPLSGTQCASLHPLTQSLVRATQPKSLLFWQQQPR